MALRFLGWRPRFNDILLGGVTVIMVGCVTGAIVWFALPTRSLEIAELQPAVRVIRHADFPVGASRTISWGERIILVVRSPDRGYVALQGTSPTDGCLLEWDAASLRVVSPCNYLMYDLVGNVVRGLSQAPLQRYSVFVRGDFVYVTEG